VACSPQLHGAVESEQAFELTLHVDHVFPIHHAQRSSEDLLQDGQLRALRQRAGGIALLRELGLPDSSVRFTMSHQPCVFLFGRDGPESIHANEVTHREASELAASFARIAAGIPIGAELPWIVAEDQARQRAAAREHSQLELAV
jgi:hypothetical protein